MTLRDYVLVVRRRMSVVGLTIAVTVATAFALTMLMDDEYRTSAVLRLDSKAVSAGDGRVEPSFIERLTNTYARIANSDRVAGDAARSLGLAEPPAVDVDPIPNTELLNVTVETGEAARAANLANAVSQNLIARVRELNQARAQAVGKRFDSRIASLVQQIATEQRRYYALQASGTGGPSTETRALELETTIRSKQEALAALAAQKQEEQLAADRGDFALAVVDPARVPESPSGPTLSLNLAVGLLLGILGGIAIAFLFESLTPTVRSPEEIAVAASEVFQKNDDVILGRIPKHALQVPLAVGGDGSFHQLRMAVFGENGRAAIRSLLVTSVRPEEGKSAVLVNLAASLARSGNRVLVVDADLHEPTLHAHLGVDNDKGLSSILSGWAEADECIHATSTPGLCVLTSGPEVDDPTGLLVNSDLAELYERFFDMRFDTILVDGPPVLEASDSIVLARAVDAAILVVHPTGMQRSSLQAGLTELRRGNAPLLGVVLTEGREPTASSPDRPTKDWAASSRRWSSAFSTRDGQDS
jgi:succinoglycan biosynthesis transport protein ExoP